MTAPAPDTLSELFVALSTRWRTEDGSLAVGIARKKLLEALGASEEELRSLLDRLAGQIGPLGLEVAEYHFGRDRWFAVRSIHTCPNDLDESEQATLGVVIAQIEGSAHSSRTQVPLSTLKRLLVRGSYLTLYRLEKSLTSLEHQGFLARRKNGFVYGPRTLLEFSPERRKNIEREARELVF